MSHDILPRIHDLAIEQQGVEVRYAAETLDNGISDALSPEFRARINNESYEDKDGCTHEPDYEDPVTDALGFNIREAIESGIKAESCTNKIEELRHTLDSQLALFRAFTIQAIELGLDEDSDDKLGNKITNAYVYVRQQFNFDGPKPVDAAKFVAAVYKTFKNSLDYSDSVEFERAYKEAAKRIRGEMGIDTSDIFPSERSR